MWETHPKGQGVSVFVEEVSAQSRSSAVQHLEQHDARGLVAQAGHLAFKMVRDGGRRGEERCGVRRTVSKLPRALMKRREKKIRVAESWEQGADQCAVQRSVCSTSDFSLYFLELWRRDRWPVRPREEKEEEKEEKTGTREGVNLRVYAWRHCDGRGDYGPYSWVSLGLYKQPVYTTDAVTAARGGKHLDSTDNSTMSPYTHTHTHLNLSRNSCAIMSAYCMNIGFAATWSKISFMLPNAWLSTLARGPWIMEHRAVIISAFSTPSAGNLHGINQVNWFAYQNLVKLETSNYFDKESRMKGYG
jgi:hypothetical protein